jgi:ATP/maltotriose-dependent transcriptional regulator MalT
VLACDIVEAGGLPPEIGLSTAATALEMAETLGYPAYKLTGTKALHTLLTGDPTQATSLARQALETNDDRVGRADDLATLARAHMAAGDNKAARAALGEAEKTVPWWPRVAATRARLDIS